MGKILKGILIVFGIFVMLAILGALFGEPSDSTKYNAPAEDQSTAGQTSVQAETQPENEQMTAYVIGDRVVSGDIAYTITNVQTSPTLSNEYSSTSADGIFVIVDMNLENVGKETITMTSNYVKLVDDQARVFESDTDSWMYIDNNDNLLLKQLQPGLQTKGRIVFDVPVGGAYGAMVTGSIWGGDEQLILLGTT